jgi:hypothetical protein
MAEMLVIRMGEVVNKPLLQRRQTAEAMREAAARYSADAPSREQAKEAAAREAEAAAGRRKAEESAYWGLHAGLTAALRDPQKDPALFQRLCNRRELQLVLMTAHEARSLTQAQMQAWGTGGLEARELRAVLHALRKLKPQGKPAVQFFQQLTERVNALPVEGNVVL